MARSELTQSEHWTFWAQDLGIPLNLLNKWSKLEDPPFRCVFCDTEGSLERFHSYIEGHRITACPTCHEYKGIEPYIEGYHY